jgi:hypothetical protein
MEDQEFKPNAIRDLLDQVISKIEDSIIYWKRSGAKAVKR